MNTLKAIIASRLQGQAKHDAEVLLEGIRQVSSEILQGAKPDIQKAYSDMLER
jgi:hypothetical protein